MTTRPALQRALWLALALTSAACAEDPGVGPAGTGLSPAPKPTSGVTASHLSGTWVFGETGEPADGATVACSANQIMTINDESGVLSGGVAVCGGPCAVRETFAGTRANGLVTLDGQFKGNFDVNPEAVTYSLRFDAPSQHLRGTRSGRPFWAAPLVKPTDGSCDDRVY